MKYGIILIIAGVLLSAFQAFRNSAFYIPENWPKPVYNFQVNPTTPAGAELGRALFYDPILSRDSTISCASCHSQYTAFTHVDHALSHGIGDSIGTRNSPALMNLAWQSKFMWDGAINHLDMQALAPITHPDEMGESIPAVLTKLQRSELYPAMFRKAFGSREVTGEYLLKALSQFMLTLVSAESKYDSVMRNQAEFTPQEKNGYQLFRKNCEKCHKEPLFSTFEFRNNGLPADTFLNDYGRMKITQNPEDSLLFKIPTLRNIEYSAPYMHDGRYKKIKEVLRHYTSGIEHSQTLAEELQTPVVLTSNETVDITAFLLTLTDKKFLFNPEFSFPQKLFLQKIKK
ncbi:MAG: c-type cytochrome [Bacteroidia bacterium]|nr:c-type cytochrome [Bacteroidia bacterium]